MAVLVGVNMPPMPMLMLIPPMFMIADAVVLRPRGPAARVMSCPALVGDLRSAATSETCVKAAIGKLKETVNKGKGVGKIVVAFLAVNERKGGVY